MREGIHPDYHEINVTMTDGSTFKTRSTKGKAGDTWRLDIDSKSHPAYTGGEQKLLQNDQVDKFSKRYGAFSVGGARKTEGAASGSSAASASTASSSSTSSGKAAATASTSSAPPAKAEGGKKTPEKKPADKASASKDGKGDKKKSA